jgi:putative transposase
MPPRRAPRLKGFSYVGQHRYHVRFRTWDHSPHFACCELSRAFGAQLFEVAAAKGFTVLAYCVMPDHVHLLVEGIQQHSSLPAFVARLKQATGYQFQEANGRRLWQVGYFDRILREDESPETVARYIVANPIRAGLAHNAGEYPFAWSMWNGE